MAHTVMMGPSMETRLLSALLLFLTAVACGETTPGDDADLLEQSVINGTREPSHVELTPGQQLGVVYITQPGGAGSYWCSGTLIGPRLVSTARHCSSSASNMAVAFGRDPSWNDPVISVSQVYDHPSLDVTVLVLREDATVRVPSVQVIPYNTRELSQSDEGATVEVGGYGETRAQGRSGRWFGALEIADIDSTSITIYGDGDRGFCFGDSGGPVFMRSRQGQTVTAGVISATQDRSCLGYGYVERLDVLSAWIGAIDAGENPGDGCNGLDYLGRCDGDVAQWCEEDILRSRDCGEKGVGCAYIDDNVGYICDCTNLPPQGRCHGPVVQTCTENRLTEDDCTAQGLTCAMLQGRPACAESPTCEEGDTWCEGSVAVACAGGELVHDDCGARNFICVVQSGTALCKDPSPQPDPRDDPGPADPGDPRTDDGDDEVAPEQDEPTTPAPDENAGWVDDGSEDHWAGNEFGELTDEDQAWLDGRRNPAEPRQACTTAPGDSAGGSLTFVVLLLASLAASLRRRSA